MASMAPVIPPRWLLRGFWAVHRGIYSATGHRIGALHPAHGRVGTLFLLTTGRTSGLPRRIGLYYLEDGDHLVVVASNAGADTDPAWLRNLEAKPDATVELGTRAMAVQARRATAAEAEALWPILVAAYPAYAEYLRATSRAIPIVILEPAT